MIAAASAAEGAAPGPAPAGGEYYFDRQAAAMAIAFFHGVLTYSKGPKARRPFILESWQRRIVADLWGWKRLADGSRRYRRAFIAVPRKNGKSELGAGLALLLLFTDNEYGAEIYSAAADRDQASIIFEVAKTMITNAPALAQRAKLLKRSIYCQDTMSIYRVLSADVKTKHGLNSSGIIFDELHTQPNRELWDVLTTSQGARKQPMTIAITTAGYDRASICFEQWEYARQVRDGIIKDPAFYPVIYAAGADQDWQDPKIWAAANPNLGVSLQPDYIAAEAERARNTPAYQNTFRRLHLNQWTSQESRFLDMDRWDACGDPLPDLAGCYCCGGIDLGSTTDLAALALCFPPQVDNGPYYLQCYLFMPGDNLRARDTRDRANYELWAAQGLIELTPGNVIDYAYIRSRANDLGRRYKLKEIAYDPWNATQLAIELGGDGFTMIEFRQGFGSLSAPTKEFNRLIIDRRLIHGANPALRWMADNTAVSTDPAGNIKPNKARSSGRIDGIVGGIMALGRAMLGGARPSVYDKRGIRSL